MLLDRIVGLVDVLELLCARRLPGDVRVAALCDLMERRLRLSQSQTFKGVDLQRLQCPAQIGCRDAADPLFELFFPSSAIRFVFPSCFFPSSAIPRFLFP